MQLDTSTTLRAATYVVDPCTFKSFLYGISADDCSVSMVSGVDRKTLRGWGLALRMVEEQIVFDPCRPRHFGIELQAMLMVQSEALPSCLI